MHMNMKLLGCLFAVLGSGLAQANDAVPVCVEGICIGADIRDVKNISWMPQDAKPFPNANPEDYQGDKSSVKTVLQYHLFGDSRLIKALGKFKGTCRSGGHWVFVTNSKDKAELTVSVAAVPIENDQRQVFQIRKITKNVSGRFDAATRKHICKELVNKYGTTETGSVNNCTEYGMYSSDLIDVGSTKAMVSGRVSQFEIEVEYSAADQYNDQSVLNEHRMQLPGCKVSTPKF